MQTQPKGLISVLLNELADFGEGLVFKRNKRR
ncbi:hypothetical protein DFP79_0748 [Marinomonas balearica]|uniref:Uncharacterized protein n=1 Tax=Marinomonas balearica TaxID=491947 RepID=A0A4R6ME99_9GAMM|nr:hypothetical protein DFP79_0748 [Marinomonas balearica]